MNPFNNGKNINHSKLYPHRLKVKLQLYNQEMEDFCHNNFGAAWAIRYISSVEMPHPAYRKFIKFNPDYILCFENEEDAVLFKLNHVDAKALTEDESAADMRR